MRDTFAEALKTAMRERDAARLSTLRLITAAIKDRDIEARGKGKDAASDEEILQILAKMIRQREESAAMYDGAGRPELAAKERAEVEVIRSFQPVQMGEEEVRGAAQAAIQETGAASPKDMGKVMAVLKERHAGQMDFGKASALVKGLLAG